MPIAAAVEGDDLPPFPEDDEDELPKSDEENDGFAEAARFFDDEAAAAFYVRRSIYITVVIVSPFIIICERRRGREGAERRAKRPLHSHDPPLACQCHSLYHTLTGASSDLGEDKCGSCDVKRW